MSGLMTSNRLSIASNKMSSYGLDYIALRFNNTEH